MCSTKDLIFFILKRVFHPYFFISLHTYIIISLVLSSCVGGGKYTAMRKGLDSINTLNREIRGRF